MKTYVLVLVSFLFVSTATFANDDIWGPTGHRVTGKIAEKHLTKKAKRQIDKLLMGESLAFVSTYGDQIKSDKKYNKFYSWHYVNMHMDESYAESKKNPKGDLVTGINECIATLKNKNSSKEDKVFSLKMLVHLIGDLHQPMHIGRKEDKGGNSIQVRWFYKGTNLHRVWDTNMIEGWGMSYVELAKNAQDLSKSRVKAIKKGTVLDWVQETHKITKVVYASVKPGDKLSYRYSYDHFGTVRKQLQKGGIRLAKVLNEIFR